MNVILASLLGMIVCVAANAQSWPSKPVRDRERGARRGRRRDHARARRTPHRDAGPAFLVENRAGGDGYIGFEAVGRAEPDGYTLLYSPGSSMMIAPHIVNRPDLDPTKVLTPVVPTAGCRSMCLRIRTCRSRASRNSWPTRAPTRESSTTARRQRDLAAYRHRGVQPRGEGQAEPRAVQGRRSGLKDLSAASSISPSIPASASPRRRPASCA